VTASSSTTTTTPAPHHYPGRNAVQRGALQWSVPFTIRKERSTLSFDRADACDDGAQRPLATPRDGLPARSPGGTTHEAP